MEQIPIIVFELLIFDAEQLIQIFNALEWSS